MKRPRRLVDHTGKRFGKLVVIELDVDNSYPNSRKIFWKCRCDCGNIKSIWSFSLTSGRTISCGCYGKELASSVAKGNTFTRKAYGESSFNMLFSNYKTNAKLRGIPFELSKDRFKELTQRECNYCGAEPNQIIASKTKYGVYTYNGIDRVDSSKGYEEGNVVPCCKTCNRAKQTLSQSEFLSWIDKVYRHTYKRGD